MGMINKGIFSNRAVEGSAAVAGGPVAWDDDNWAKATARMTALISQEFKHISFTVGRTVVEVQGITPATIQRPAVKEELQKIVALAISLGREELLINQIVAMPPNSTPDIAALRDTEARVKTELRQALRASGRVMVPVRLSLNRAAFDLRIYLGESSPQDLRAEACPDARF